MAEQQKGEKQYQQSFTVAGGLNKSSDKLAMSKTGDYSHMKNGFPSSEKSDEPFVQNAPSNELCCELPEGFFVIGKPVFVQERDLNILTLVNPLTQESEIGYFYPERCEYVSVINSDCFNFNINHPIKGTYKIINCELSFYFQDGFNPDRKINLDNLPWKQVVDENGCVQTVKPLELECGQINIQNELIPPVVKVTSVEETGALLSGAYQFAVAYANINGVELSSYYSKTNIVPIYQDSINLGWNKIEGSAPNVQTNKSIVLGFENIDTRYQYLNIAVIKTIQGSPVYEKVATVPVGINNYIYTGRETTRILSIDQLLGLNPDYVNSKTLTSGNNYLIRANLSTQDEGNYQPLANLIELGWAATKIQGETAGDSYKNPLRTTNTKGYQRGEVYPFGIRFLFSNGTKSNVYHIPGRLPFSGDRDIINTSSCNLFELTPSADPCVNNPDSFEKWEIFDTATVSLINNDIEDCANDVFASGDFAFWESSERYPCNKDVWGDLAGQKIRHHKFPSNETFHIQNQPYASGSPAISAFTNDQVELYPIGVVLKQPLDFYLQQAVQQELITQEEADLIEGYEIVRGDRRGQKSVIAKGLLYNMFSYRDQLPGGNTFDVFFPNYPFNDLNSDSYLNNSNLTSGYYEPTLIEVTGITYTQGETVTFPPNTNPIYDAWNCPFTPPTPFVIPETFTPSAPFEVQFGFQLSFIPFPVAQLINRYSMLIKLYDLSGNPTIEYDLEVTGNSNITNLSNYSKSRFTFHSPDTHFRQPFLGTYLKNHVISYGGARQRFEPVEGHPLIKPAPATDAMNHAVSCKSEGNYNNWLPIPNSNDFRRQILDSGYLAGNSISSTNDASPQVLNNRTRESSVYLRLGCEIDDPQIEDTSKFVISETNKCSCRNTIEDRPRDAKNAYSLDSLCTTEYNTISSYYSSLNTKIPNQYGDIFSIRYLSTGQYLNKNEDSVQNGTIIFGGDTFITKFSVLRKMGFFNVDFINQSAFGVNYTNNFIGAKPNFYLRNTGGIGKFVIDRKQSNLDCSVSNANRNGWVYLYNRGVAHFYAESDVNTELRYSGTNIWEKWYPTLKQTTFSKWTEQLFNPIEEDNTYLYNWNYSKANEEEALFTPARDFTPNRSCKNSHPRRIIYSNQSNEEESSDNWLVYPANQYYDVESYLGDIVDVQAIDAFKILVRCENGSLVFNAYDTLKLDNTTVTVGTGGMFAQRPQTFGNADAGYVGSDSKFACDVTPNGVFFADTKAKQVYWYNGKMQAISSIKMSEWFMQNLPIKFLKQIDNLPNFDKLNSDNPFLGIGLQSVYDYRYNLWFLTKKDFVLKDETNVSNITISELGELLYSELPINFYDTEVFEDVSWTISFRPSGQQSSWFSFHDFKPNFNIYGDQKFFSGMNNYSPSIYKHWSRQSFQTYYGDLYPFEVTITTSDPAINDVLQSIEYELKNYQIINPETGEVYYTHLFNFNKALINTDNQSSGILHLIQRDKNNLFQNLNYPAINISDPSNPFTEVLYSKIEGNKYRLNQFIDIVADKTNGLPIFQNSLNGIDRKPINLNHLRINNEQLRNQKFRNSWFDVTLIQDQSSEYKMVLNLLLNRVKQSQR